VIDANDRCPNTPRGERVGVNGCSCDTVVELNFEFDSAQLTAADIARLDELAVTLRQLEFVEGNAVGHTDSIGDEAFNQGLSERRAQAVADYLASKGIAAGRLAVSGRGETQPVADNSTAEGRAKNRRVVLTRSDAACRR
jgi:outer membrane protein OmpA-like peptidoglycan-associated protein